MPIPAVRTSAFAMPMAWANRASSFGPKGARAAPVARTRPTRAAHVATRVGDNAVASSKCGALRPGLICASVEIVKKLKVERIAD